MKYDNRFNTKIKIYPDKCFKATYCNKCIFSNQELINMRSSNKIKTFEVAEDWEKDLRNIEKANEKLKSITVEELEEKGIHTFEEFLAFNNKSKKKKNKNSTGDNLERSLKRAKEKIFDMAYINDFKYFVTVTFDTQKVDSSNAVEVMKKLRVWLMHQKQRYGMEYILVPEYHKKNNAIHCHLLITEYPLNLLEHAKKHLKGGEIAYNLDGTPQLMYTSKGQPIYNMRSWKYGFSTCIPVYKAVNQSNIKLAHYITKYMTKDVHKIFGKFYWSSKGLKRDVDTEYFMSDYDSLPLKEYEIPNTDIRLKYDSQFNYTIGGENNEK